MALVIEDTDSFPVQRVVSPSQLGGLGRIPVVPQSLVLGLEGHGRLFGAWKASAVLKP